MNPVKLKADESDEEMVENVKNHETSRPVKDSDSEGNPFAKGKKVNGDGKTIFEELHTNTPQGKKRPFHYEEEGKKMLKLT